MKAVSIITIVYGGLGSIWSMIGLLVISIQKMVFHFIPDQNLQDMPLNFHDFIGSIHQLYLIFMPLMLIIAIFYLISGIRLLKETSHAVNLTRLTAILNILWYIGYAINIVNLSQVFTADIDISGELIHRIMIIGVSFGAIFACGYPVFLLIYLAGKKT